MFSRSVPKCVPSSILSGYCCIACIARVCVGRLALTVLALGVVTTLNHSWSRLRHAAPHTADSDSHSAPKFDCNTICDECNGLSEFKATYDGFPLSYEPPAAIPDKFAGNVGPKAVRILVISDRCEAFSESTGRLVWENLVDEGHELIKLCPGYDVTGASLPSFGTRVLHFIMLY